MKKNIIYLSAVAFALIITTVLSVGYTFAFGGWGLSESRQAITDAIDSNNYNAWLEAVGENSRMAEIITEENFPKFVEMHNLKQAGNLEGAKAIMEEIGIDKPFGFHGGFRGRMNENSERFEAIKNALDNNDYSVWLEAVGENAPILEKINENNFSRFVEAHKLREQAREIMEELGIAKGPNWF